MRKYNAPAIVYLSIITLFVVSIVAVCFYFGVTTQIGKNHQGPLDKEKAQMEQEVIQGVACHIKQKGYNSD